METFNIQAKVVKKCYSLLTQAQIIDPSLLKLLKVFYAKLGEVISTLEGREIPRSENPIKQKRQKDDEDDPPIKRRHVDEEDIIETSFKEAERVNRNPK